MAILRSAIFEGLPRRISPLELEFSRGITILWGMNGSGKTTLLKVIHSALTTDTAPLLRLAFKGARVETESDGDRLTRTLNASGHNRDLLDIGDKSELETFRDFELARLSLLEATQTLHWTEEGTLRDTRPDGLIPHRYLPVSRIFDFRNRFGRRTGRGAIGEVLDEVEYDRVFAEQIQYLWSDYRSGALSQSRVAQQDAISRILAAVLSGDDDLDQGDVSSADARRFVSEFIHSNRGLSRHVNIKKILTDYEGNPVLSRVVATIIQAQQKAEEQAGPERRFAEVLDNLFGNKRVDLTGPRKLAVIAGEEEIPIASLSSGEKQLMRILLETLVSGGSPILIDEPEISLHVDWQAGLLEAMHYINPDAQIIVATHSPEIVGNGRSAKVLEV